VQPEEWLGLSVVRREDGETGVRVSGIEAGSPAEDAGILPGDLVLEVAGHRISGLEDFEQVSRELTDTGKPLLFRLQRGSSKLYVAVAPAE